MSNTTTIIRLAEIAESPQCTMHQDGQKVFEKIHALLKDEKYVEISFEGVVDLTSAFLNASIGQLYGIFSEEFLQEHLSVSKNTSHQDQFALKRSVDRAKGYFRDHKPFEEAAKKELGEDHE